MIKDCEVEILFNDDNVIPLKRQGFVDTDKRIIELKLADGKFKMIPFESIKSFDYKVLDE